jgi:cobalt/nickel transport system permease protein
MGIIGPLLTALLYKCGKKLKLPRSIHVFIAASLGCLLTYCITAVQLAVAYPSEAGGILASLVKFLGVFAPTQIPLAFVEGVLTVLVVIGMEKFAKKELESIKFIEAK